MQFRGLFYFTLLLFLSSITTPVNATIIQSNASGLWSEASTWLGGVVPGPTDSVLIDGHLVEATNVTTSVQAIKLTNDSGSEGRLTLNESTVLTVDNGFYVQGEGREEDLYIHLYNNAKLIVNGLFHIERLSSNSDGKKVGLYAFNNAEIYANDGFIFDYQESGANENNIDLFLSDYSYFEVNGNSEFYNRNGKKLSVEVHWNAKLVFNGKLEVELSGGDTIVFFVTGISGKMQVADSTTFLNNGAAGLLEVKTNLAGRLIFNKALNLVSTGSDKKITLEGDSPSISDIKINGDLNLDTWDDGTIKLKLNSYSYLFITGNINRVNGYGSLSMSNNSKLVFNGSTSQKIPGSGGAGLDSFKITNLLVCNTSDSVILDGPLLLTQNLELDTGIIFTTPTNKLILADAVGITGGSGIAYIDGPMTKIGNTNGDFTYPIGKSGFYAPLTITEVTNPNFEYTAEYFRETPDSAPLGTGLNNISALEFWEFDASTGSDPVGITISWMDAAQSGITNMDSLVVTIHDEDLGLWKSIGSGGTTGGDNVGDSGTLTHDLSCPPPCCHSVVTFGSTSAVNALPLDLVYFAAEKFGDLVNLNWITTNELNMKQIEVQQSTDGFIFQTIDRQTANGGTGPFQYVSKDNSPTDGANYYRLKMTEIDGRVEYSELETIHFEKESEVKVFPNPVNNLIQISGIKHQDPNAQIQVYNQSGQQIFNGQMDLSTSDYFTSEQINVKIPGLYFLYITSSGKTSVTNFVKE